MTWFSVSPPEEAASGAGGVSRGKRGGDPAGVAWPTGVVSY